MSQVRGLVVRRKLEALPGKPGITRTFRTPRQRKSRSTKESSVLPESTTMETDNILDSGGSDATLLERASLCLPNFENGTIVHAGDEKYRDVLKQCMPVSESNATERLVDLKAKLRTASTHDFWAMLMEDMCDITNAQCGYVAKRILVDDQDMAVEMPPLGEPGSCLMGVAFYLNNGADVKSMYRDYRYHAYGTPCEYMKHDKVFIVPEKLSELTPNNPNKFPWKKSEAYIGVPLFLDGKCFAHFGMIWSSEGAGRRGLSWSFIEMFMHSLEDLIVQRMIEGQGFVKSPASPSSTAAKVIPLAAITASQSLKPYARSLSHELRTPMQGVVGMLDIMYSAVLDAIVDQEGGVNQDVFRDLKSRIEVVQDSSRRAVEAADNVIYACDLNMQMPETPVSPVDSESELAMRKSDVRQVGRPFRFAPRKHDRVEDAFHPGPPLKKLFTAQRFKNFAAQADISTSTHDRDFPSGADFDTEGSLAVELPQAQVTIRSFMRQVIAEALKSVHPQSEKHERTEQGEMVTIQTVDSHGQVSDLVIGLSVRPDVPEVVIIEEPYLRFALLKVVDNALKFTDTGSINITVTLVQDIIEISIVDTGCGIATDSQNDLFKPHFQEDASRSRIRDGLGLSLFNAKAQTRRFLNGDLTLERSCTEGPSRGSEFLLRLPLNDPLQSLNRIPRLASQPLRELARQLSRPAYTPVGLEMSQQSRKRGKRFDCSLGTTHPLRILVAEDNQINQNVALGCLHKLGYAKEAITLAFDGGKAVELFEESVERGQRFDAVLMDIWMPRMDGYEATRRILELDKGVKIIAVTADITSESIIRAREVGMCGFLTKPFKVRDMERIILEFFGSGAKGI